MSLFKKRPVEPRVEHYPADAYNPVIRSSICTGEKVACMRDRSSGKLIELMLLQSPGDLERFCRRYGGQPEDVKTVY